MAKMKLALYDGHEAAGFINVILMRQPRGGCDETGFVSAVVEFDAWILDALIRPVIGQWVVLTGTEYGVRMVFHIAMVRTI
jgi:hypothetical protein